MARTRLSPCPALAPVDHSIANTSKRASIVGSGSCGWILVAVIGLAATMSLSGHAYGQGSLTTSDGLTLSLSSGGSVTALKTGSTNYASALPSGFFYRETSLSSPNLATNGSFESGSGTPTGWSISGGTGGTWSIDSSTYSAGGRSMKLYVPGSTSVRSPDFFTTSKFTLLPNTPYRFSCNIKTYGLSSALTIFLLQQDSTGAWTQTGIAGPTGTTPWKRYSITISPRPNIVQGYVKAYLSSGYGTAWLDDVQLTDVFGGHQPVAFGGTVTSSSGVLTQRASSNGLTLSATFSNVGSAVKVVATLTDTTATDRAVELSYRLPLDVPGWTWDQDFVTPRAIGSGTRYENLDQSFAVQTLGHTHSIYPFATVRNSAAGFSLAVPMGPLMDRFSYDDLHGFRVTYDLGLSTATTRTPSKATVTFWIYSVNPKWGMRAAAEKYYALNPASFTSSATKLGAWVLKNSQPLSSVANPQDFGWGYEEGNADLDFDNANGILGMHYLSSPEWDINISGYTSQPPYSVLVSTLSNAATSAGTTVDGVPTSTMASAVIASSPLDHNGYYHLSWNGYYWYGNRLQMYPVLPYSTLPGGTYPLRTKYSVDYQVAAAQNQGNTLGGVFLDNTTYVFGNIENYKETFWAYNNTPLSFSYRTGKTVQYVGDSMADFTAAFRNYLHSKNLVLMASIVPGSYVWFAPNVDVVSGETGGAEVSLDRAYARRTLSYKKIYTNLCVPGSTVPTAAQVLAYLRQALLLGYFPGFNGIYWDNSTAYNRDRGLFQLYIPLIKKIAQAGWRPVNYATASDPAILLERFGDPSTGTFYISAQNNDTTTNSFQITLDGAGLGISSTTTAAVKELVGSTTQAVTRSGSNFLFSDNLAAGEVALYAVTLSSSTSSGSTPVTNFTYTPGNPLAGQSVQFTDTSTNSPTSWRWDFGDPNSGSANSSTLRNPTHTFVGGGNYRVTLYATNAAGTKSGAHTVTVTAAPVTNFTYSPSTPSHGQTVQFTDTSTNSPTSWRWDFGDPNSGSANSSTRQNPTHVFSVAGNYRVTLYATNSGGTKAGAHTVTVK